MTRSIPFPADIATGQLVKLRLTAETLKHISAKQLLFLIKRRLFDRFQTKSLGARYRLNSCFSLDVSLPNPSTRVVGDRFIFINQESDFTLDNVDWHCPEKTMLWRYNLHYFDYLKDDIVSDHTKLMLVADWIEQNPVGSAVAWDSFTTSLRIINWIKWFEQQNTSPLLDRIPDGFERSLNLQGYWLARNIEYDIAANHLFKNLVALVYWSHYFSHRRAILWREKSLKRLLIQLNEQFLADGGHYERSPMYHSLVLEFCLDCVNLLRQFAQSSTLHQVVLQRLVEVVVKGLCFLQGLLKPDFSMPLVHDSAYGIANDYSHLLAYAESLDIACLTDTSREGTNDGVSQTLKGQFSSSHKDMSVSNMQWPSDIPAAYVASSPKTAAPPIDYCYFNESGYITVTQAAQHHLLFDAGQVSPSYQPGHSHCSLLSYELTKDGHHVIIDSGVHDYENSAHRRYARSTRAHSCVQVDDREQSEMWGGFRVARRAYVRDVRVNSTPEGIVIAATMFGFSGAGATDSQAGFKQHREIVIGNDFSLTVRDNISADDATRLYFASKLSQRQTDRLYKVCSFIQINPCYRAVLQNNDVLITDSGGHHLFTLQTCCDNKNAQYIRQMKDMHNTSATVTIESGWYYPEFGKKIERQVIVIEKFGRLPVDIGYRLMSAQSV